MSLIEIYTDGSCIGNPGPGGYAFVVLGTDSDPLEYHVSGGEKHTTNNRMELTAVIESLKFTSKNNKKTNYTIYSDSMYVINCAKGKWARKKNIDLWEKYLDASKGRNINWVWVRGHNGNKYNEIVDCLAKQEAKAN